MHEDLIDRIETIEIWLSVISIVMGLIVVKLFIPKNSESVNKNLFKSDGSLFHK